MATTSLTEKPGPENEFDEYLGRLLANTQKDLTRARQNRITTFGMAHKQGWTYERIGRQVGITGAAVRRLLRRNPEKVA